MRTKTSGTLRIIALGVFLLVVAFALSIIIQLP